MPLSLRVAGTVRALHAAILASLVETCANDRAGAPAVVQRLKLLTVLVRQCSYERLRPGLPTEVITTVLPLAAHPASGPPGTMATRPGADPCGADGCGVDDPCLVAAEAAAPTQTQR